MANTRAADKDISKLHKCSFPASILLKESQSNKNSSVVTAGYLRVIKPESMIWRCQRLSSETTTGFTVSGLFAVCKNSVETVMVYS
jgi:hypothetical protein